MEEHMSEKNVPAPARSLFFKLKKFLVLGAKYPNTEPSSSIRLLCMTRNREHVSEKTKSLLMIIENSVRRYQNDAQKYGRKSYQNRRSITILGASTTLVLGLKIVGDSWSSTLSNLALILSSVLTVWSAFDSYGAYGERFVAAESARRALRQMCKEIYFVTVDRDLTDVERDSFFERESSIVTKTDADIMKATSVLAAPIPKAGK